MRFRRRSGGRAMCRRVSWCVVTCPWTPRPPARWRTRPARAATPSTASRPWKSRSPKARVPPRSPPPSHHHKRWETTRILRVCSLKRDAWMVCPTICSGLGFGCWLGWALYGHNHPWSIPTRVSWTLGAFENRFEISHETVVEEMWVGFWPFFHQNI